MAPPPTREAERGMTTAEYAVGTLGAATVGACLLAVGADEWFLEVLRRILSDALDPGRLLDLVRGRPFTGLRP